MDDLSHRVAVRLGEEAVPTRPPLRALVPDGEAEVAERGVLQTVLRVPLACLVSRGVEAELQHALDPHGGLPFREGEHVRRRERAAVGRRRQVVELVAGRKQDELVRLGDAHALSRLD